MQRSNSGGDPPRRILVVDDDPQTATVLRDWFRGKPHEVLDAENGEDGLRRAAAEKPDLILLDLKMPGMDGMAVAQRLKADAETEGIPVILLTADRNVDRKVQALDSGAEDYITKPFSMKEVDARIRAALQRQGEKLHFQELAAHDGLTGLYTFREFDKKLREEWQRAERYDTPLSVVFLDLDHFKQVNDSLGHQAGDQVLREFAMLVAGGARANDVAARYGGEEFAIILPHTEAEMGLRVAQRIVAAVADFVFLEDRTPTRVTVSAGVATFTAKTDIESMEELVRAADAALYRAKDAGRNCVVQHQTKKRQA